MKSESERLTLIYAAIQLSPTPMTVEQIHDALPELRMSELVSSLRVLQSTNRVQLLPPKSYRAK